MNISLKIINLQPDDTDLINQVAVVLVEGFREHYPNTWPNLESALEEIQDSFLPDRISQVAINETRQVLGWIGGILHYEGKVWEIHPLVVKSSFQRQGIGRLLLQNLEICVRKKGGLTLWVGTDDENNQTSLSGANLYENTGEHIAKIQNLNHHPYEFYQKCGFVIVGVMPDANGIGKPDIYMAKSIKIYND